MEKAKPMNCGRIWKNMQREVYVMNFWVLSDLNEVFGAIWEYPVCAKFNFKQLLIMVGINKGFSSIFS